jgi:hypothetical protein
VDDICVYKRFGNDIFILDEVKSSLKKVFSMKDLGGAAYVLASRSIGIDLKNL